jgi:hypothetical protein
MSRHRSRDGQAVTALIWTRVRSDIMHFSFCRIERDLKPALFSRSLGGRTACRGASSSHKATASVVCEFGQGEIAGQGRDANLAVEDVEEKR